ncbi:eamA domain, WAT1-related protein [Artemisia annua]|uniref:WAT1-related protein n=1 Tax=Artemisia annua TaxID=35608 RepID=A0A2U1LB56_ARTAN|nr:eamA domain, WAT1-related protein [Artemisia annua]
MMISPRLVNAYESNKPYLAMLLVQTIYAGMALLSKASISSGMNPSIFVVYRQAFATFSLAPIAYFMERNNVFKLSYTLLWKIFFSSLIGITITSNLYYSALNHTSATFAAASNNLVPAITFVIALILRMERMHIGEFHGWAKLIGAIISVSGALVFAFVKGPTLNFMPWYASHSEVASTTNQTSSNGEFIKGPFTMLCANTLWSCWSIMQAPIMKEYPAKLSLVTLQCLFSVIQATVWAIAMERKLSSWKLGWDINLLSVAYCGIIVTALTYWLQLWSIQKRGPVFTAMFTPLALIITAVVSMFVWKETLYVGSVCGAVLLAGGLYCVLWGKSKEMDVKLSDQQKPEEDITLESIKTQE